MEERTKAAAKRKTEVRDTVLCALFASLIALGAFIKVPAPGVAFTLQPLFANMAALLLGQKRGTIAVAIYLTAGLIGLPVFTEGGGLAYVLYPTFGYLLGFLFGNLAGGYLAEKLTLPAFRRALLAGFVNLMIVYICGMIYLYLIRYYYIGNPIGFGSLIVYCFLIFLPGDSLGCVLCAVLYKRLERFRPRRQQG